MTAVRAIAAAILVLVAPPPAGASETEPKDPYGVLIRSDDGGSLVTAQQWLDALSTSHAGLVAAGLRVEAAEARAEGARGVFDLALVAKGGLQPIGKYEEAHGLIGFEQPTALWGMKVGGGYRQGGDFPLYKGQYVTGSGGEFYLDVLLPLWRDRDIDSRRAKIANAALKRDGERIKADMKTLEVSVKAVTAFWLATVARWELHVAENLLRLATVREAQIAGRIRSGQLPEIARVDNERLVLARRGKVAKARAGLAKALASLAIYAADDTPLALPIALPVARLPAEGQREAMRVEARARRPDLMLFKQLQETLELQLRVAENARGPRLDLKVWARQDVGDKRTIGLGLESTMVTEVGVGVDFGLPVQQREAEGEIAAVSLELRALSEDLALATRTLDAGFDALFAEIDGLSEMARLAEGAYLAAIELERAERRAFELGQSTLVIVNVREEAAAAAAMELVAARIDLLVAVAKLEAYAGRLPRLLPD